MKNICFVLLGSLLAGCSSGGNLVIDSFRTSESQFTEVAQLSAQLRSVQVKPVSLNRLGFQLLALDTGNSIEITAHSPVVNFPEGNSFVAALLLPENVSRFTFALESKAGRTVFVPSVVFLNDNLQQVARIDNAEFNAKGFFVIEKAFTAEKAQEIRYILVYSKDRDLDGRSELVDPIREYELKKGNDLPKHSFPKLYTKHSPIGHLNIRFKDVFFSAQRMQAAGVKLGTVTLETNKRMSAEPVTILSDTEAFYLGQISKAVNEGDMSRAKSLVEEAERAGSTKAQAHYKQALATQQE